MANTTIQIGNYTLPAAQQYALARLPQYAEFTSVNGIVWRDRRNLEQTYVATLGWIALTPFERGLVDAAWNAILDAAPGNHVRFVGLTGAPYDVLPDEKSNDYTVSLYQGAVAGTGWTALADIHLIFRVRRVFV